MSGWRLLTQLGVVAISFFLLGYGAMHERFYVLCGAIAGLVLFFGGCINMLLLVMALLKKIRWATFLGALLLFGSALVSGFLGGKMMEEMQLRSVERYMDVINVICQEKLVSGSYPDSKDLDLLLERHGLYLGDACYSKGVDGGFTLSIVDPACHYMLVYDAGVGGWLFVD